MRSLAIAGVFAILCSLSYCDRTDCSGLATGFYCLDSSRYAWCYGSVTPTMNACASGTVCQCGSTTSSPCNWPSASPPSDCQGAAGSVWSGSVIPVESSVVPEPSTGDSSVAPTPVTPSGDKKLVAYFTNWPQYHTANLNGYPCRYTPSNVDASHITHINYAFAVITPQFTVTNYEWDDFDFYTQIQALKTQYPALKTLISIGGWNFNYNEPTKHYFSSMAETSSNRQVFIQSAIKYARDHGFDGFSTSLNSIQFSHQKGIDIDWEYPAFPDQGGRPQDTPNFTLLLKELRAAIDAEHAANKLLLTIAAPAGEAKIQLLQVNQFHQYLDWINLMTYDLHGSWDNVVGPHTALHSTDGLSIDHAVQLYLSAGVPSEKLILGLAAYGRTWTLAQSSTSATRYGAAAIGPGTAGVCTQEGGFLSSFEIDAFVKGGATSAVDSSTTTAFAFKGNQFVTYDTLDTHHTKTLYLCQKQLGGAMFWAMDLDTHHQMIAAVYNTLFSDACPSTDVPDESSVVTPTCDSAEQTACRNQYPVCLSSMHQTSDFCLCTKELYACAVDAHCPL
ncbi:chitinase 2 [Pelomyxa schiedti]|nr:chitinase 2 [Pelomyxa schiedti]